MDNIKRSISIRVQSLIMGTNWNTLPDVKPFLNRLNKADEVSKLTAMINICTPGGMRFFEVIVKERY